MTLKGLTRSDSPAPGAGTKVAEQETPRLYMKEDHLLTLKCQTEGQASHLTHIQGPAGILSGTGAGDTIFTLFLFLVPYPHRGHHAYALPLPHSSQQMPISHSPSAVLRRTCISERGANLHEFGDSALICGAVILKATSQGIPLNCLTLEARWPCVPKSHGTVTN